MNNYNHRIFTKRGGRAAIKCSFLLLAMGTGWLFGPVVNAQEVQELSLSRESIAMALASSNGWVQGYLPQDEAQPLQLITKSDSPVLVRFTVVQRFEQENCGRIQVDMSQENVPTKDFSTIAFVAPPVQLNACADGDPPEEAVDVVQATQEAKSRASKALIQGDD